MKKLIAPGAPQRIVIAIIAVLGLGAAFTYGVGSCGPGLLFGLMWDEALYSAAQQGDVSEMEKCLAAGANPDALFDGSEPVLIAAIESGNPNAVRLLIEHNVNLNVQRVGDNKPAVNVARSWPKIHEMLLKAGAKEY